LISLLFFIYNCLSLFDIYIYISIFLTETGIEFIDGILAFLLDNNEEEVLCEVERLKLGEWLADELISSVQQQKQCRTHINWFSML